MKISSEILRRISGFLLIFLAFYDKISRLGVRRCERLLPGNTEPGKGIFAEYVRKSGEAYPAGSVRFFQFDISVVSFLPCFFPGDSGGFRLFYREREGTHESVLDRSALLLQIVLWDNFSFIGKGNLPDEI